MFTDHFSKNPSVFHALRVKSSKTQFVIFFRGFAETSKNINTANNATLGSRKEPEGNIMV
jgi:hypothetical protein